ncbi:MAG: hypothetical protein HRU40_05445 [Saprospiraceae bacterium]|nr:hypothetical protein [Saprospiraceae bacterium]
MRIYSFILIWIFTLVHALSCSAQFSPFQGMNYQAVARHADGLPMADQALQIRLSFVSYNEGEFTIHFKEIHQVTTDNSGLFGFIIGKGRQSADHNLEDVPWASHTIWFNLDVRGPQDQHFVRISSTELQSVPYAFYAAAAGALTDTAILSLRNASIYWTIGGNDRTRPHYHFLGTRDEQDFNLATAGESRWVVTKAGQINIIGGESGSEDDYDAYPLTVQSSKQGIYIKINDERSGRNNFMTFADTGPGVGPGTILGAIEGETIPEVLTSTEYIFTNAVFGFDIVAFVATALGTTVEAIGEVAAAAAATATKVGAATAIGWIVAAGADFAKAVALAADAIALAAEISGYNTNAIASAGVTYSTGGADYAEWLLRKKGESDMSYGEIVGIHAGQISRRTEGADHVKVISLRPGVLGNAPKKNREPDMEKVAFLGQVPVHIIGSAQVGDYIIPSGNNDGFGIAVHPDSLATAKFKQIVGVAWELAEDKPTNTILIGVGLHKNRLAGKVQEIEDKVDRIMAFLQGEGSLTEENDFETHASPNASEIVPLTAKNVHRLLSDDSIQKLMTYNEERIRETFRLAQDILKEKGLDFSKEQAVIDIFNDPVSYLSDLQKSLQGRINIEK